MVDRCHLPPPLTNPAPRSSSATMNILLSTTSLSFPFPSTSTPLSTSAAFSLSSVAASPTPTPLWCRHCSQSNRCHRRKALGCLPYCRDFDGTRKIYLILRWIRLCPVWALKKLLCLVPWYGGLRNWNMKLKIWSFWVWNNGFCLFFLRGRHSSSCIWTFDVAWHMYGLHVKLTYM